MLYSIINRCIINIIPYLPLGFVRMIAGRYVAGENHVDALSIVKSLNEKGYSVTLDILGEHSINANTAKSITEQYISLYKSINKNNLDCNISVKPTHLGFDINMKCAQNNILLLLAAAKETHNFLRIDMENSKLTDATFELYNECIKYYSEVGIVLQSYLYRSIDDLKSLSLNNKLNFRLCKGIYKENQNIAIQNRNEINENFITLLRYAFENNIYIGIATHDIVLLEYAYKLIQDLKISSDQFEFQVLYGVPISQWLDKHLQNGYKVRVYVPFGEDWYEYSLRRIKENPKVARYIIKNLFRK